MDVDTIPLAQAQQLPPRSFHIIIEPGAEMHQQDMPGIAEPRSSNYHDIMSKPFTTETASEEDPDEQPEPPPAEARNYMTPGGFAVLQDELRRLLRDERPKIVEIVAWAAGNGDRSENGDYLYGKKRLREIDRRVRFLIKRLEAAEIVDSAGRDTEQIFFGSTVRLRTSVTGGEQTVTIVRVD